MQQYVLARCAKWEMPDKTAQGIVTGDINTLVIANKLYDAIERDEKVAADNSMPDTRDYLDTVTGANGHG